MPRVPRPDLLRKLPADPPTAHRGAVEPRPSGLVTDAPPREDPRLADGTPTHITWDNIEEWVIPRPKKPTPPVPVRQVDEVAASHTADGIRLARQVLRDEDSSKAAKKVARMLIDILDTQPAGRAEPETSSISLANFRRYQG